MRGKIGLVVGLGVGYVLGTRAGRKRYEQLKTQWLKLWETDVVQDKVAKAKGFAATKAMAVPAAVWEGAVKVAKATTRGATPGEKLDSALATGKRAAAEVADAVEEAVEDAAAAAKKSTRKGD